MARPERVSALPSAGRAAEATCHVIDLRYERRAWTLIYLCLGLVEGGTAEFILFNPERITKFTRDFMKSKSVNTPFLDKELKGMVERVVYRGEELLAR